MIKGYGETRGPWRAGFIRPKKVVMWLEGGEWRNPNGNVVVGCLEGSVRIRSAAGKVAWVDPTARRTEKKMEPGPIKKWYYKSGSVCKLKPTSVSPPGLTRLATRK
jgi:hypothetical protein